MRANRSERLTLFHDGRPSIYLTVPRDAWPEDVEPVTAVGDSDAVLTAPICDGTVDGVVRDVDSSSAAVEFRLVEAAGRQ